LRSVFWLDLFPSAWPIAVKGGLEGVIGKNRFSLSGAAETSLFGLQLLTAKVFVAPEGLWLEGQWLGAFLKLNLYQENHHLLFQGATGFRYRTAVDFGPISVLGQKVANNVHLTLDIETTLNVTIAQSGFTGDLKATFKINGKVFALSSLSRWCRTTFPISATGLWRRWFRSP
jgi:hypothetical protein